MGESSVLIRRILRLGSFAVSCLLLDTTVAQTVLGIAGTRFTVNGKPAFLLGISYYGALAATPEFIKQDLAELQTNGFNWIRVWATWSYNSNDVSAVDSQGRPREPFFEKLDYLEAD